MREAVQSSSRFACFRPTGNGLHSTITFADAVRIFEESDDDFGEVCHRYSDRHGRLPHLPPVAQAQIDAASAYCTACAMALLAMWKPDVLTPRQEEALENARLQAFGEGAMFEGGRA